MKILSLRLSNINSLKGEQQVIDFTKLPLSDTGIFAIIGSTGSGKSTILDAITLALYNKTPRINSVSKTNLDSMGAIITHGAEDAFSEIEYQTQGKNYRSRWSIKRARKSGVLQDYLMELTDLDKNEILDLKKGEIPDKNAEIIGLDFDQFSKSVVLSQGEFAKFLKSDIRDRDKLLEKITGTHIYRQIGIACFEKLKTEKVKLEELKIRCGSTSILSKEEEDFLISESTKLEVDEKQLKSDKVISDKDISLKKEILKLENNQLQYTKNKEILDIDFEKLKPAINKLKIHEELLPLKSEINEYIKTENNLDEINNKLLNSEKTKSDYTKSLVNSKSESQLLKSEHDQICKRIDNINPINEKLQKIDNKINTESEKLIETKKRFKNRQEEYQKNETNIKQIIEKKDLASEKLSKTIKELENDKICDELSSEISLIKERFAQTETDKKSSGQALNKLEKFEVFNKIKNDVSIETICNIIDNELITNNNFIENNNLQFKTEKNTLSSLEEKRELLLEKYRLFEKQIAISKDYISGKNKILDIQNKETELIKNTSSIKEELKINGHDLEILDKYIEELKIKKERQQLQAKYDNDRKLLRPDTECFLCGSKEHPFVKSYSKELDETSILLKQKETEKINREKKKIELEKKLSGLEMSLENIANQKNNEISGIKTLSENFAKNDELQEYKIEDIEQLNSKFAEIIDSGKVIAGEIKILKQINEKIEQNEILSNVLEKVNRYKVSHKFSQSSIQKYSIYLKNIHNDNEILDALQRISIEYQGKKELKAKLENEISENTKIIEEKKNNNRSIVAEIEEIKYLIKDYDTKLESLNKEKSILLTEIHQITDSKYTGLTTAKAILTTIINEKEKTSIKLNETLNLLTKYETEIEGINVLIENYSSEIGKLKITIQNLKLSLLPGLEKYSFATPEDALSMILEPKQVEEINTKYEQIKTKQIELNNQTENNQIQLKKLQESDKNETGLQDLENKNKELEKQISEINKQIGINSNKLKTNELQKTNLNKLLSEKDRQQLEVQRWDGLNTLIGDGQGAKYSKFAQELTMQHLISKANYHLSKFNTRYLLKKEKDAEQNDIVVIDTHLANTERSAKTLSGGESFLLSLSLALGLSDLAGQNTKIESLFIDEGFGTLDPEALDIALDALENLQSRTNRTIGIISHVQALKDRIPVQIQLEKTGSGYSSYKIVG